MLLASNELHLADLVELVDHLLMCLAQSASAQRTDLALAPMAIVTLVLLALLMDYILLIYAVLVILLARCQV